MKNGGKNKSVPFIILVSVDSLGLHDLYFKENQFKGSIVCFLG